ncbi:MAG: RNA polymerase sigma factor [Solirubrobacteraceae bacterium]
MRRGAATTQGADAEARFRRLYAEHGRAVLAYAVRRSSDAADAADVVADTFLVAWRRLVDIPPGREARLWLYGVARRMLANQRRAERRRERLAERLRRELPVELAAAAPTPGGGAVMAALGMLAEADREVLLLAAWEQLEPAEIATVLGITRTAARSRLHRARVRLREQLGADAEPVVLAQPVRCEELR